jgi:hypothetical protein
MIGTWTLDNFRSDVESAAEGRITLRHLTGMTVVLLMEARHHERASPTRWSSRIDRCCT